MSVKQYLLAFIIAGASLTVIAAPESFTIDPEHTFPNLEFSHMGISVWRGKFNKTTGKVILDRAAKTGTVDIEIDIASINFGHDGMNEHALADDWLNVKKFPTMTYQGKLIFKKDTPVSVEGNLTLLGVTKPVPLELNSFKCIDHPYYKKEVCGADAEGQLDRADFGLTQYTHDGMGKIRLLIQVEAMKND
jgi:polyisoprenoid-binding protein YceI